VTNPTDAKHGNWIKLKRASFYKAHLSDYYSSPDKINIHVLARYVLMNNIENFGPLPGYGNGYGLSEVEFTTPDSEQAKQKSEHSGVIDDSRK
jgi:hypothetical protein